MEGFKPGFESDETIQVLEDIDALEKQDFYARLGLSKSASFDELKSAFRNLSAKFHPDKVNSDETLRENYSEVQKRLGEAYSTLSNEAQRSRYDAKLQYFSPTAEPVVDVEEKPVVNIERELSDFESYIRKELEDDFDGKSRKTIAGIEREITQMSAALKLKGIPEAEILNKIKGPLLAYYAKWLLKKPEYGQGLVYPLARLGITTEDLERVRANPQTARWF